MKEIYSDIKDPCFRNIYSYLSRSDSLIQFTQEKIIKLNGNFFSNFETQEVLEALIIKFVCDWEWFIERHIIHLLARDTSTLSDFLSLKLPKVISFDEASAILNGTGYFNFKNCTDIKSLAKKILVKENNSFESLEKEVINNINNLYVIRNYIAHRSTKSKKTLSSYYTKVGIVKFIEPGEYFGLIYQNEKDPNFTNFFAHTFSLLMSSLQMWEFLFPKSLDQFQEDGSMTQQSILKLLNFLRLRPPQK